MHSHLGIVYGYQRAFYQLSPPKFFLRAKRGGGKGNGTRYSCRPVESQTGARENILAGPLVWRENFWILSFENSAFWCTL